MNRQNARNTAAGMVRDALERLTEWSAVQDLRHFSNTGEKATRLLNFAETALAYFEAHYDFPQDGEGLTHRGACANIAVATTAKE